MFYTGHYRIQPTNSETWETWEKFRVSWSMRNIYIFLKWRVLLSQLKCSIFRTEFPRIRKCNFSNSRSNYVSSDVKIIFLKSSELLCNWETFLRFGENNAKENHLLIPFFFHLRLYVNSILKVQSVLWNFIILRLLFCKYFIFYFNKNNFFKSISVHTSIIKYY